MHFLQVIMQELYNKIILNQSFILDPDSWQTPAVSRNDAVLDIIALFKEWIRFF